MSGSSKGAALSTASDTDDAQLKNIIASWANSQSFSVSVAVKELTGSQRKANYNDTASIVTASTFKLYVAYAVLLGIEQGTYHMSAMLSDGHSISTDMSTMILNSDNNAARALGFMVGWPKIDSLLAAHGMPHTDTNNYVGTSTTPVGDKKSTAQDLSIFLQKLYTGQLLNSADTQYLLGLLETQHYRSGILAGVPGSVKVADKPGWLTPADGIYEYVQNDVGIVYGPKSTYEIVIITGAKSMTPVANLSKLIYSYLQS